jgi:hypothetical protein
MSGVTSLSGGGGTPFSGAIGIVSNNGAITVGQDTSAPNNNITLAYNPNGITAFSVGGAPATGNITFDTGTGLSYTNDGFGTVTLNTFAPATGTATDAVMVAQNLENALAWASDGGTPPTSTVAYNPGAVVIYSSTPFVCLVAQPIGSVGGPVNGPNWQSIGGGGPAGNSINANGASVVCETETGDLQLATTRVDSFGNNSFINLQSVGVLYMGGTCVNMSSPYNTNPDVSAAVVVQTGYSISHFDEGGNGPITFVSNATAGGGSVTIGGGVTNTGLYVSNTELVFNGNVVGTSDAISNGGATLGIDGTGSLSFTTTDFPLNVNGISLVTTVPSTTPGANAGQITINSGGDMNLLSAGVISLTSTVTGNVGNITIGGDTPPSSGLYVTNTQLTFNGATLATGGNWAYRSIFNTTTPTAYAGNDVVFDTVNTTETYICILAYTTATPYPAPSTDSAHWILFASNAGSGGAGSTISGGVGTVACSASGVNVTATTDAGFIVLSSTNPTEPAIVTIGGGATETGLYVSNTQLLFNGTAVGVGGGNWSYKGTFNITTDTAYAVNDVVFDTVNDAQTYICASAYTTAPPYPAPSTDPTHWTLFATNSGGGPGGSSISADGTSVVCNVPAGGVTITAIDGITGVFRDVNGGITLGVVNETISSNIQISDANSAISINNNNDGVENGTIVVGGTTIPNIGLYVSNTELLFNGTIVAGEGNGTAIANAGTSLSIDGEGSLTLAPGSAGTNLNKVFLATRTATGPTNAGDITISSGGQTLLATNENMELVAETGGIILRTKAGSATATFTMTPNFGDPDYLGGGVLYNCGAFSSTAGYGLGSIVSSGGDLYLCVSLVTPNVSGNPVPSDSPTNWLSLGGNGGSVISAGSASVTCDDPPGSGNISLLSANVSGGPSGSQGSILIDTLDTPTGSLDAFLRGSMVVDTTISGGAGMTVKTFSTTAQFEDTNNNGSAGVISFKTAGSNASTTTIGGAGNSVGLYVGPTNLTYNGVSVASYGGAFVATSGYALGTVVTDTGAFYISIQVVLASPTGNPSPPDYPAYWQPLAPPPSSISAFGSSLTCENGNITTVISGVSGDEGYIGVQPSGTNMTGGTGVYDCGTWTAIDAGFCQGSLARYGTDFYLCYSPIQASGAPGNPPPDTDTAHWLRVTSPTVTSISNVGSTISISSAGDAVINTTATTGGGGAITLESTAQVGLYSTGSSANASVVVGGGSGNDSGAVVITGAGTFPGLIKVGGITATSGLYVSNTELVYNGNPVTAVAGYGTAVFTGDGTSNEIYIPTGKPANTWASTAPSIAILDYNDANDQNWIVTSIPYSSATAQYLKLTFASPIATLSSLSLTWEVLAPSSTPSTCLVTPT